jgi:Bacterial Ig-like domain (group 2)
VTRRTLLAFGLATLLSAPVLRAQDTVTVGIAGQLSGLVGDSLHVPVYADMTKANGALLGSYTLRVTWNPSVLFLQGVGDGAFSAPAIQTDSTGNGVLYASGISAQGLGGQFNLFDLHFTPLDTTADSVRLGVTEMSAAGTLTDLRATATILTHGAAYCGALGRWGDLDGDGLANSRDALAILSSLVGLSVGGTFNLALGDADGDGLTNSRDALIILSYAVGLQIPGERVLLLAAGPCTGTVVPQFAALPDTADLVPGQLVRVKVFGKDSLGAPTSLDNVTWSVADPTIAAVDASGGVTARAVGTTTLTAAVGPGAQIKIPVIVRPRRGTWYVDAQRATLSPVQLGTQRWPFATPEYVFGLEAEGDTIRIAPGTVDYEFGGGGIINCGNGCLIGAPPNEAPQATIGGPLRAGVIVIGDTLSDGTRPVLRADGVASTAFEFDGGTHAELRNLVLQGFPTGVALYGLQNLTISNVDYQGPTNRYSGVGVDAEAAMDTLRVTNSHFISDSVNQGYEGIYVYGGAHYVEVDGTTLEYMGTGLELYDVDSLDLAQSQLRFGNTAGILVYDSTTTLSARISQTRILDASSYWGAVYIHGTRYLGLDHSYIYESGSNGIQICALGTYCYGGGGNAAALGAPPVAGAPGFAPGIVAGTKVSLLSDSIQFRSTYGTWLDVEQLDSLTADSLWLQNPADTALGEYGYIATNYARVTNSRLLNLYYEGFEFDGRQLVVDNTQFTGCAVAGQCGWNGAMAIQAYAGNDSGPRISVTNSSFTGLANGVFSSQTNSAAGPMVVANNVFDSVAGGIYLWGDSLAITNNVFTKVRDYALEGQPGMTTGHPFVQAQVLRNQVTCAVAGSASLGLMHNSGPALFQDNAVRNCQTGLSASNAAYATAAVTFRGDTVFPDSVTASRMGVAVSGALRPSIVHSRIVGGYEGINFSLGDATDTVTIDTTAVSQTGFAAINLSGVPGPAGGVANNIGSNLGYGVYDLSFVGGHALNDGSFVGNGNYSVYNAFSNFSFDATSNWWGVAGGPGTAGADSVSGTVNAGGPLGAPPGGLPALAPQLLAASAAPRLLTSSPVAPPAAASTPPLPRVLQPATQAQRAAQLAERRAASAAAHTAHLQAMRERAQHGAAPRSTRPKY